MHPWNPVISCQDYSDTEDDANNVTCTQTPAFCFLVECAEKAGREIGGGRNL